MNVKNMNLESQNKKLIINLPQQQIVIDSNGVQCNPMKNQKDQELYQNNIKKNQINQFQMSNNLYDKQNNNNFQGDTDSQSNSRQVNYIKQNQKPSNGYQNIIQRDQTSYSNLQQQNNNFQKRDINQIEYVLNKNKLQNKNVQVQSKQQSYLSLQNQTDSIQSVHDDEQELYKKSSNPIFSRSSKIESNSVYQKKDRKVEQNVNKTNSNTVVKNKQDQKQDQLQQYNNFLQTNIQKTSKSEILQLARGIVQKALNQQNETQENQKLTQQKISQIDQEYMNSNNQRVKQQRQVIIKQNRDNGKFILKENIKDTAYEKQNQNINEKQQFQNQQSQWSDDQEESKYIDHSQLDRQSIKQNIKNSLTNQNSQQLNNKYLRKRENNSNMYIDSQQFEINQQQYEIKNDSNNYYQDQRGNQNSNEEYFEQEEDGDDDDVDEEEEYEQSNQVYPQSSDGEQDTINANQTHHNTNYNNLNFKCNLGKNYTYNIVVDQEQLMHKEDVSQDERMNEEVNSDNDADEEEFEEESENEVCEEDDIEQEEKVIQEDENSYEESEESNDYYQIDQNEEMVYGVHIPQIPPLPDDLEFAYQEQQIYEEYEPNDQSFSENNGLTKAEIMSLPTIVYTTQSLRTKIIKQFSSQQDCSICLNNYIDKEILRVLPCEHRFHRTCIDKWLLQNSKCVICKYDLLQNQNQEQ